MPRSIQSTEGSPRIPPRVRTVGGLGFKLAHVGSFGRPETLLGHVFWLLWRFVAALGQFWCVLARSGLDFGGFRAVWGRILALQGHIFQPSCAHARLRRRTAQNVTKPQFMPQHTSQAMRATPSIVKNRSGTLTEEAAYDDRGQDAS